MGLSRRITAILLSVVTMLSFTACSDEQTSTESSEPVVAATLPAKVEQNKSIEGVDTVKLKARMATIGLDVSNISEAPVAGFQELETPHGIFYISNDGDYFLQGKIYKYENASWTDTKASSHAALIEEHAADMIVYPADNEKHVVTVFTDITCGYCLKLHKQMEGYNDLGITVRYLAYPRQGPEGQVADKMAEIWCADDRNQAMSDAKAQRPITKGKASIKQCQKMITDQFMLGRKLGVSGTPAIFLSSGELIPGYKPPRELLKDIESY
jgi:thiol:disulfide interchange protein DsbC